MTSIRAFLAPHLHEGNTAPAQRFATATGGWSVRSYSELTRLVDGVAAALQRHGVRRGDRVAVVLRTRADWSVLDLAAATIGAPLVPIYPTASPGQVQDVVDRARPVLLVSERPVAVTGTATLLLGLTDGDLGDLTPDGTTPTAVPVDGEDLFSISFSSGSTGAPKGCPITHANEVAVLRMALALETDPVHGLAHRAHAFVYLPLAHASARLQQMTTFAAGGELLYGSGGTAEVLAQVSALHPTYVPGVPRLFEQAHALADGVPERLRRTFGDRLRYALTGGAPIAPEVLAAYAAAGISLVEGYGLTETSTAVALNTPHANRPGSAGKVLPGMTIRIAPGGEILARGDNVFAGYLDDPAATAAAFTDGWFRTGDLGHVDADGYLFVTGRTKNLLVTSTGKNIAPEPVENALRLACRTADVLLVGDRRPYLVAVLAGSQQRAETAEVLAAVRTINAGVAPPERIRKVVLLTEPFGLAAGELTASGKVVRRAVLTRLSTLLDDVYAGRRPEGCDLVEVEGPRSAVPA